MALMGIDFAWSKPTAAEAKAAGARWAAGYYSNDPSKNLTASLVSEYIAAGLSIVGVWETTTSRATAGYSAGVYDAQTADSQRAGVGLPDTAVIHLAVDEDTDWASVEQYFAGASSVLGQHRVGVYGGIRVIAGAAAAGYTYLWQADAWSNGQWDPHATIHQESTTLFGGNADVDYAEVPDFGQTPHPEVDMPLTPADVQAIWNYSETDADTGKPVRFGAVMAWMDRIHHNQANAVAEVKSELDAVKAAVAAVSEVKLTDAQVSALVAQIVPVLVPQLVTALGHQLDGTK